MSSPLVHGAVSAVEAAGVCQLGLAPEAWPEGAVLRVRMGLHSGDAHVQGRRLCRARADQPVCPGEGGRARRAGAPPPGHARPGGRAAGRRVRAEAAGGVPAARSWPSASIRSRPRWRTAGSGCSASGARCGCAPTAISCSSAACTRSRSASSPAARRWWRCWRPGCWCSVRRRGRLPLAGRTARASGPAQPPDHRIADDRRRPARPADPWSRRTRRRWPGGWPRPPRPNCATSARPRAERWLQDPTHR